MESVKKYKVNPDSWIGEHGDYLFRFALFRVNNRQAAEDLVQETFLAALKAIDSFKGWSSERTWFTSILKRKIIDRYRKSSADQMTVPLDNEDEDFLENGHWNPARAPKDWGSAPDDPLHQHEFMHILKKCISAIPKKIASVFTMKEIEDIKSEQICKELKISSSNLWVMLHRARTQLRRCLELNWFEKQVVEE